MMGLKLAWTYTKKYWKVVFLFAVVIFGAVFFQRKITDFSRQMREIQDQHDRELREIQRLYEEETRKREENQRILQERLVQIQQQYAAAQKELDDEKKKMVLELVEKYKNDPEELAKRLSDVAGFQIVLSADSEVEK